MSFRQIKSFDLSDYDFEVISEEEAISIAEESAMLKEIFVDINKLVEQSRVPLEEIESKTEICIHNVEKGNVQLTKAAKANKTKNTIILVSVASLIGACVGGPIGGGAAAGISTAAIGFATLTSILGGAIIGALTGAGAIGGGSGICYRIIKK